MKRLKFILDNEHIEYNDKLLADLIMKHAPDWRRVINECQRFGVVGSLNTDVIIGSGSDYVTLLQLIKAKDFKRMRQWVVNNSDVDSSTVFRGIYDVMTDYVKPQSIPQLVLILADYQYKNAFVADHELNTVACMTEIMAQVEFQ